MTFETNRDVLNWYEKQPRTLTKEFIDNIDWKAVKNHPLDKKLIPVLLYMRDVEVLTDMYYDELRRTPTGKDPIISKFMERWGLEEITHAELLNRFLNEAGVETGEDWKEEVRRNVSTFYKANTYLLTMLTNLVGKKFTATHMTFGAIHEMSTAQGYRRLIGLADNPVLTKILTGIMREESAHMKFYWSVARLELKQSPFARKVARFVVNKFWTPVGQGAKTKKQTDYTIGTLFGGTDGLEWIDKTITQRVRQLPGLETWSKLNETVTKLNQKQFA